MLRSVSFNSFLSRFSEMSPSKDNSNFRNSSFPCTLEDSGMGANANSFSLSDSRYINSMGDYYNDYLCNESGPKLKRDPNFPELQSHEEYFRSLYSISSLNLPVKKRSTPRIEELSSCATFDCETSTQQTDSEPEKNEASVYQSLSNDSYEAYSSRSRQPSFVSSDKSSDLHITPKKMQNSGSFHAHSKKSFGYKTYNNKKRNERIFKIKLTKAKRKRSSNSFIIGKSLMKRTKVYPITISPTAIIQNVQDSKKIQIQNVPAVSISNKEIPTNEIVTSESNTKPHSREKKLNFHHAKLGEHAVQLWVKRNMTDILIRVTNHTFQAHRAVLTCYCPFFKENLLTPERRDIQGIELHNVTPPSFEVLLSYMYTGRLKLTCKNIADVYKASRLLQMQEITNICSDILSGQIGGTVSALYLYVTAKRLGILEAMEKAYAVISANFEEIIGTMEFLELDIDLICEILQADPIGARDEISLFLAAVKWLDYNLEDRERFTMKVMSNIRFFSMDLKQVLACFNPPYLKSFAFDPDVFNFLLKATCYVAARTVNEEERFWFLGNNKPRTFLIEGAPQLMWDPIHFFNQTKMSKIGDAAIKIQKMYRNYRQKILNSNRDKAAKLIQNFYRSYRKTKYMEKNRKFITCANNNYTNEKFLHLGQQHNKQQKEYAPQFLDRPALLAIGGMNPQNSNISIGLNIERYDIKTEMWDPCGKLPQPRHHTIAVYLGKRIYIIGGCDPKDALNGELVANNSMLSLDLQTLCWTQCKSMADSHKFHSATTAQGKIFVMGGKTNMGRFLNSVEIYDPKFDDWQYGVPMLQEKIGVGLITYKGALWTIGGMSEAKEEKKLIILQSVQAFNFELSEWEQKCNLPVARAFIGVAICQGCLYAIGGTSCNMYSSDESIASFGHVWKLEPTTETWIFISSLPSPRHGPGIATLEDKIFLVGGLSTDEVIATSKVDIFDPSKNTWNYGQPFHIPISGLALLTIPSSQPPS